MKLAHNTISASQFRRVKIPFLTSKRDNCPANGITADTATRPRMLLKDPATQLCSENHACLHSLFTRG